MADNDEPNKVCLEFADFPGAHMAWLVEKAKMIEDAMSEKLAGVFLWHSVVASPEIDGFKVFFQIDPDGDLDPTVPERLVAIIREIASDDLPGERPLAA